MDVSNNPRSSLSVQGQADGPPSQVRRSSLSFFRRISSSERKFTNSNTNTPEPQSQSQTPSQTQTPSRSTSSMLLNSHAGRDVKQQQTSLRPEGVPSRSPRIPSFHFDPMTSPPASASTSRRDLASPPASPPTQYSSPPRRVEMPEMPYRLQYTPAMPPPVPSTPATPPAQESSDPFVKSPTLSSPMTTSITNRGRLRRKKDATPFNILVLGTKNCGKTAFIEFLRSSLVRPTKQRPTVSSPQSTAYHNSSFPSEYLETDVDGSRVGITLYDSPGLEKSIVDLQLQETTAFIESKFEETFVEEQKLSRAAGARDTHIHCVLLLLDPTRLQSNLSRALALSDSRIAKAFDSTVNNILDSALDIDVLRALHNLTTVVPLISKADTVTVPQMGALKRAVWKALKGLDFNAVNVLDFNNLDEDTSSSEYEEDSENEASYLSSNTEGNGTSEGEGRAKPGTRGVAGALSGTSAVKGKSVFVANEPEVPDLPLSVISPDVYEDDLVGRRFAWGFADPNNSSHCDFTQVKESVFTDWRDDLRDASRVRCYENWRTTRLKKRASPIIPRYTTERNISGGGAQYMPSSPDIGVAIAM